MSPLIETFANASIRGWVPLGGRALVGGIISVLNGTTPSGNSSRVAIDSSGNLYVTGNYSTGSSDDVYLVKYNSLGVIQWQRSLGSSTQTEYGSDVDLDSSGNIYVGGASTVSSYMSFLLLKYNSSGSLTWSKQLNGSYDDYMSSIAVDTGSNNAIWITGATPNGGSSTWYQNWARWDSSGTLNLQQYLAVVSYGGWGYDIAVDSTGYATIVGYGIYSGIPRFTVIRTDGSTTNYKRMLASSGDAMAYGVSIDSSNNSYVVGQSGTYSAPDAQIVKYNSSGAIQWQRVLYSDASEAFNKVFVDKTAGFVYVNGYSNKSTNSGQIIAKYNLAGVIQWQRRFIISSGGFSISNIVSNGGQFIYLSGNLGGKQMMMKLPADGSGTGDISIAGVTLTYTTSALTDAASTYTDTDQGSGIGSTSLSGSTGPSSEATPTLTQTIVNF